MTYRDDNWLTQPAYTPKHPGPLVRQKMAMTEWFKGELGPLEKRTEVRTYRVALTCPKCGEGEMRFTGMTWPTGDPGYHHQCTKCEYLCAIQGHRYPETRMEGGRRRTYAGRSGEWPPR